MVDTEAKIQQMVDRETAAWNDRDADALLDMCHPDAIWPWPPNSHSHDPETWVMPLGRFNRERWKKQWEELFHTHDLVHNRRHTVRIVVSEERDGGFAVVDVDTLWRHRDTGKEFHWKGRACKGYTLVNGRWLFIMQTGLLEYGSDA